MNCNNNLIKEGNSMKKLGVIFGGMSTENKVSCVSGASVIKNLKKEKYENVKEDRNCKVVKIHQNYKSFLAEHEKKMQQFEEILYSLIL